MDISSLNKLVHVEPAISLDKRHASDAAPAPEAGANESISSAESTAKVEDKVRSSTDDASNKERETPKNVEAAVTGANHFFEQVSRELRFERSMADGTMVIKVTDQKSGEVIRQIPSEEMLEIAKELDTITGLLFKDSA